MIAKNHTNSKLTLVLAAGLDENNKNIIKNKTFSNVKASVSNENLYELGTAISDLQSYPLTKLVKKEEYELVNEIE